MAFGITFVGGTINRARTTLLSAGLLAATAGLTGCGSGADCQVCLT